MKIRLSCWLGIVCLVGALASHAAAAGEAWDQPGVTALAGKLHHGVAGLRQEIRSVSRDVGTGQARAYYRLVDNLRVIERETRYLHGVLVEGAGLDETLSLYVRIAILRRDCAEEMRRQFLGSSALERIDQARSIVKQMDPYYGFDPSVDDHKRVLRR